MQNKQKNLHRCTYEGCASVFNRPYRLAQHLLVHNNVKAFPCPDKDCTKAYTNKSHLDRHTNRVHKVPDSDMLYSCPTCSKRYANRQNLKRHIKLQHKLKIPFSCDICKLKFLKKHQLTSHMFQHTGVKSFSCELCHKEFASLQEKKKHVRSHKTHCCIQCPAKFSLWSMYQKHVKTDHLSKEFICNECNRHFKQRSHMVRHVRTHLKIQARTFPCPYEKCERIYSRNSNLRQHISIKHERITHQCIICGAELCTKVKNYTTKKDDARETNKKAKLTLHLKLHSQSEMKRKPPKTRITGRKERKDVGRLKVSTALKLSGIPQTYKPEIINLAF